MRRYFTQPRIILCRFTIMIKCRRSDSLLVQLLVSQLLEYVLASFTPFAKQPFSRHKALLTSDHVYICPQDFQSLKWDPHSSYSNKFQCASAAFDPDLNPTWWVANGQRRHKSNISLVSLVVSCRAGQSRLVLPFGAFNPGSISLWVSTLVELWLIAMYLAES